MRFLDSAHLAYCTNVHPAESWNQTFSALKQHTLAVRDEVVGGSAERFAIGLRLSAKAATDLLAHDARELQNFKKWLDSENCYVFTINGFPYDDFHGISVKENVYKPDWTTPERLKYTTDLFIIIAELCDRSAGGSVSTLPGSFKAFAADEHLIFANLYACGRFIQQLASDSGTDLHLGLEPEPLGHFENTEETLAFFQRFRDWARARDLATECIDQHIGLNYDTCHFALEYDDFDTSLAAFASAGIRISKIHLSNALAVDPRDPSAVEKLHQFDEITYLHQVLLRAESGAVTRFADLPDFFAAVKSGELDPRQFTEARVHFHIPLYSQPHAPLASTRDYAAAAIAHCVADANVCQHFEIETYTWGVLPSDLQLPLNAMLVEEYRWALTQAK